MLFKPKPSLTGLFLTVFRKSRRGLLILCVFVDYGRELFDIAKSYNQDKYSLYLK